MLKHAVAPTPVVSAASGQEARIEFRSRVYVAVLAGATLVVTGLFALMQQDIGNLYVVALLGVVAAVAERGRVELRAGVSHSISLVPTLFAAVLCGPLAAGVVAAASFVSELRRPYLRWASYTASRVLTAVAIGIAAVAVHASVSSRFLSVAAATLAAALLSQILDTAFVALPRRLRQGVPANETFQEILPIALAAVPLYAPVVAFLAFAYEQISPFTLPLFLVPALAAQRSFGLYQRQRRLTQDLSDMNAT